MSVPSKNCYKLARQVQFVAWSVLNTSWCLNNLKLLTVGGVFLLAG